MKPNELTRDCVSYLETALWSETVSLPVSEDELDENGRMDVDESSPLFGVVDSEPLDDYFTIDDIDGESLAECQRDVDDFFDRLESAPIPDGADCDDCDNLWECANCYADDGRIMHDFWLTRNGHGAGFWDGDYSDDSGSGPVGDALTEIAKSFPERGFYVGDNAKLYIGER